MWRVKDTPCECVCKICPKFLCCQYMALMKKCLQFYASTIAESLSRITGTMLFSCIKNCTQVSFLSKGFSKCIHRKRCVFSYLISNSVLNFFFYVVVILLLPLKKKKQNPKLFFISRKYILTNMCRNMCISMYICIDKNMCMHACVCEVSINESGKYPIVH